MASPAPTFAALAVFCLAASLALPAEADDTSRVATAIDGDTLVCGAPIRIIFGRLGTAPSSRQPVSLRHARATAREKELPRRASPVLW